ncbi:hypothetical protein H2198_009023 [Neophaeococcomyces mojaviensis]|uniref:Uncharacterized protein n=1 Tax=Neophaeococcomyces mojaviensis TaxID=3383035 RepID=A0ACC2ZVX8_9EURO|nr:hypothetical protein H2198_009023 [Knufia sp. JES_112]
MEPAGLAVGVVGLIGTFTTCMQCFEYIQYGKRFGKDYESAILRLDVSRLKLARWAESVGLNDPSRTRELQSSLKDREIEIAEQLLGAIKEAFDDVEKHSRRYESNQKLLSGSQETEDVLAVIDSEDESLSAKLKRMHLKTRNIMKSRHNTTSTIKKAKWALYDKKRFDFLISEIKEHTDALILNFPQAQRMQQILAQQQVNELARDTDERLMLQIASEETDSLLEEAVRAAITEQDGQKYNNIVVTGNARAFFGHDVAWGVNPAGCQYGSMTLDGHAVVHAGNVYRARGQRQIEFGQDALRVDQSTQGVTFR